MAIQKYLQGYHGLVKTLQDNTYYYQDELGSTSHVANLSGALLEYYKYNLYGIPTYWSAANSQLPSSNYNVRDLFTGQRWVVEIGLYDDRNRFMSPDLGRFIQPDPIGFKGDGSNLYRYCGNDWANRADLMGLSPEATPAPTPPPPPPQQQVPRADNSRGYYGNDNTRTLRNYDNKAREVSGNANEATYERVFVDASGRKPSGTSAEGSLNRSPLNGPSAPGTLSNTPRLGVGNPIDAKFLSQFGFKGQQAADMQRFGHFLEKASWAPAVAVAAPVAGPLALHGLYHGGWYVAGAATATYQMMLRNPGAVANVQQAINSFITPGGAPNPNGYLKPENYGTAANSVAGQIDPKDFGP